MNGDGMKSESWLIVELGAALLAMALLSFFFVPAYEKGAWYVIGVFATALGTVIGYKFGKGMPEQAGEPKPGQTSKTDTHTESAPPPNPQTGDPQKPL
jgi:sugar phosphate permease